MVAGWLLCQLAMFAAAPIEMAAHGPTAGREACDCPGTETGQACPMHKSPNARTEQPAGAVLQSGCEPLDAALLSLTWGFGLLPPPLVADPGFVSLNVPIAFDYSTSRAELPDSPPPRA